MSSKKNIIVRMSALGMSVTADGQTHQIDSDKMRDRASSIIINELQKRGAFKPRTAGTSDRMGVE